MKSTAIAWRTAAVATAAVLATMPGVANASTPWTVTNPSFTSNANVSFATLNSVTAISASNVWSVGEDTGTPLIEHFNGSSWSQSSLPSGPCSAFEADCALTGVSGSSGNDVIAIGLGTIPGPNGWQAIPLAYQYNGTAWQQLSLPASLPEQSAEHVQTFSPTNAWVVGTDASGSTSVVSALHWDGSAFTPVTIPFSTVNNLSVNAISGSSANDIWVVGQTVTAGYHNRQFTSVVLHYDGSSWSQVTVPDNSGINDLDAVSATDAWAIAVDGTVLHWDGKTWSVATQLAQGNTAIAALSPTDVYVAGVVNVSHFDGTNWTSTPDPANVNALTGHAVLASGNIWFPGYYYPPIGGESPSVLSTTSG